jgi:hypothetical protein
MMSANVPTGDKTRAKGAVAKNGVAQQRKFTVSSLAPSF